jgi:hypothetical protein
MVANYAAQPFAGAAVTILPGTKKDSVTDAGVIALWSADFSTTAPVAGNTVTGVLASWLAAYPAGQVS